MKFEASDKVWGTSRDDDPYRVNVDGAYGRLVLEPKDDENFLGILEKDGWLIPAQGDSRGDCGELYAIYKAETEVVAQFKTCYRIDCPQCFRRWARFRAKRVAAVLFGYYRTHRCYGDKLYHCVISLDPKHVRDTDTPEECRDYMLDCMKYIFKRFAQPDWGASVVFHPYRIRCMSCGENREHCECDEYAAGWVFSPHIHLITNAYLDMKDKPEVALAYKKVKENLHVDYWNITQRALRDYRKLSAKETIQYLKSHNNRTPKGFIATQSHCEGLIAYELGHCGRKLGSREKSIRYYGVFNPRQLEIIVAEYSPIRFERKDGKKYPFVQRAFMLDDSGNVILLGVDARSTRSAKLLHEDKIVALTFRKGEISPVERFVWTHRLKKHIRKFYGSINIDVSYVGDVSGFLEAKAGPKDHPRDEYASLYEDDPDIIRAVAGFYKDDLSKYTRLCLS